MIRRGPLQTAEAALAELSGRPAAEGATVDEVQLLALALESRLLQMNQGKVGPGGGPPGLLSQADKLAQLAPSDAKVLALAGSGAYAAGNFDKARRYYSDSQQLDDKVPRSRLGLAKTLEQLALLAIVSSGDLSDASQRRQGRRQGDRAKDGAGQCGGPAATGPEAG
jgi:hypothetical protein